MAFERFDVVKLIETTKRGSVVELTRAEDGTLKAVSVKWSDDTTTEHAPEELHLIQRFY